MDENFTPKQVALALQVSESSVKRWCDRGIIRTDRTLGGHRRIPLAFLLQFLAESNRRIIDPEAIGLKGVTSAESSVFDSHDHPGIRSIFEGALLSGNEQECRKIVSDWFSREGVASLADQLLCPTFSKIGEMWDCGGVEIYQERRACELCSRVVFDIRRLMPEPPSFSPLAMGGTASGDHYQIPTQLVEMVFRESGWRTVNLGENIPFSSLLSAARTHMPKIFWLSVSHIEDTERFLADYAVFSKNLPKGILLVVGGRALNDEIRPRMTYGAHCDSMHQLTKLAAATRPQGLGLRPIQI